MSEENEMPEGEDIVIDIDERDAEYMLKEGLLQKDENGDLWLTNKGEDFIREAMDHATKENTGDAE